MAVVRHVAALDPQPCTGCKLCDLVCPSGAITMQARRAVIAPDACIGCGRCVDRCPEDIMWMSERAEPLELTVPTSADIAEKVGALLDTAGLDARISVCVCTLTSAGEVAAAIVNGASNLAEVCAATALRSGCGIYCVAPALRLLQAAGADMTAPRGHRWYPTTVALWDLSDEVIARYPDGFVESDRAVFDPHHRFAPMEVDQP